MPGAKKTFASGIIISQGMRKKMFQLMPKLGPAGE